MSNRRTPFAPDRLPANRLAASCTAANGPQASRLPASRTARKRLVAFCTGGLLALAAPALFAHHSFAAQFDGEQPITLHGVVTKVEWMNPHVYFYVDVENEDGEIENWGVEMGPPHQLQRRNWKRNSMKIGDEVTVEATRARDGSPLANARKVTLDATGEVLGAASSESQTIGRQ